MDDQELKSLWQTEIIQKGTLNLEDLLHTRSIGILDKLKKTVKWEHYINIIISVLAIGFLLLLGKWWYALGFTLFSSVIIIYYKNLYDKITHIAYTENVLEYLTDTYQILKDFKKRYIIGLIVIFPISYSLGFDVGYEIGNSIHSGEEIIKNTEEVPEDFNWFYFITVNTIAIVFLAIFIHFIFHFFYGKHIRKIKEMIENLKAKN